MPNLDRIDSGISAIGAILGKERPLVKIALRYWWLVIPAGWAIFHQLRQRQKKHELTPFNVATDVGFVISPVIGIITMAEIVGKNYSTASPLQPATPVKDAEFTTVSPGAAHV